ncbi:MAG: transglutaminase family protein [Verrucomicrobiales bacterium]
MRYTIHHQTIYHYEEKVSYSHHLARLSPAATPRQSPLSARLQVSPTPDILSQHRDHFGNQTSFFSLTTPHRELRIDSYCEIEVDQRAAELPELSPPWEELANGLAQGTGPAELEARQFTYPSPLCPTSAELAAYARRSFGKGVPLIEAARDLNERIFDDFSFDNSATTVSTPVSEVFAKRAGVCQDFAHLQLSCLRSLGLPARYVSGYLRTDPPPGKPRLIGADASHAWIELFLPGSGWLGFDATNNVIPAGHHIIVARGRDYQDISPIRGTVYGGGAQRLEIGVTVTPHEDKALL